MATAYGTVTDPQLISFRSDRVEGGRNPAGAPTVAAEGKQWVRKEYTISLFRIGQGLSSLSPVATETFTGDLVGWVGGSGTLVGKESMTYTCQSHEFTPEYNGTDIYRETAVYKWDGEWEEEDAPVAPEDDPDVETEA